MTVGLAVAALLASAAVALGLAIVLKARTLKRRHRAVLGAPLPSVDEAAERLVDAPRALYHGTRFADGAALLEPALAEPCVGDLHCTAQALVIVRESGGPAGGQMIVLPLAWVEDAALARGPAPLAGRELPQLKIRWRRGGELLETQLSLRGGMAQLEKLRRELHLRQGQGGALQQLQRFLDPKPGGRP